MSYNYNMDINTNNNLMINSQAMKTTFSPAVTTNSSAKGAVYAEKGQPMYQKEMDKDEDGVITLEEFNAYCDENDISYAQRKQLLENRLNYQLHTEHAKVRTEISKIKPKEEVYAKEGDEKYDEEIDENGDGKITYDEYIKYCEEHEKDAPDSSSTAKMEKEEDEVVIKNPSKAISSYSKNENSKVESKIENEV